MSQMDVSGPTRKQRRAYNKAEADAKKAFTKNKRRLKHEYASEFRKGEWFIIVVCFGLAALLAHSGMFVLARRYRRPWFGVDGLYALLGLSTASGAAGNLCHVNCANRGNCDHSTGTCVERS